MLLDIDIRLIFQVNSIKRNSISKKTNILIDMLNQIKKI